ncbi:MAG: hypothetical protein E2O39_04600 [Planctomycetota bacterium]|nr:MAG: hypothetical protein E2O39_04600 [Planctomycetota bacterium]
MPSPPGSPLFPPFGLLALALLPAFAAGQADGQAERAQAHPNILFLLSDDQASTALGCAGHPWLETPGMDLEGDALEARDLAGEPRYAGELASLRAVMDGLEAELGPRPSPSK